MPHRPFALVLAGGGARGYAHVGVIRALEHAGLVPSGIVGVSMGAVVAATYAARADWYEALMRVELSEAVPPGSGHGSVGARDHAFGRAWGQAKTAWNLVRGWGGPDEARDVAMTVLEHLVGESRLEQGRVPVTVCATDLITGSRVEMSAGLAGPALYASSALAGILPPLERGDALLADGVYADIAPVDIARRMGPPFVVAVDPGQPTDAEGITNGLQAVMRAMEICHQSHAHLRVGGADITIHPSFDRFVDVLDFGARRDCVASGWRATRSLLDELQRVLRDSG